MIQRKPETDPVRRNPAMRKLLAEYYHDPKNRKHYIEGRRLMCKMAQRAAEYADQLLFNILTKP